MGELRIAPIGLRAANDFVGTEHRHHPPVVGHKFAVSVRRGAQLVGVAIAGRPKARNIDQETVLEVTRVCTDGTPNACSMLYGAVARIGADMGYRREHIITYILANEPGTSLRAAGWRSRGMTDGGPWSRPSRGRTDKAPTGPKQKWSAA